MMIMLISLILLVVLLVCVPSSASSDMNRYSTKTPYIFRQQTTLDYQDFQPKKVWALLRHGTRLPSKKVISRYKGLVDIRDELLSKSRKLTDSQREAFERWKPMDIKMEHQKFLTAQGEQEHLLLGSRFRERFPLFFDGNSNFTFKHTPTQRTQVSAEKFIQGLFPETLAKYESTVVARDDPVLRPYKGCQLWRKTVKNNKEISLKEVRSFSESEHVENVVNEFRDFTQIDHLTISDVELIYTMCSFENSWQYNLFNGQSVWCSLFQNDQQLKVMEFLEDLEYYWIDGHGFEVTRKVACQTVQDIFLQFDTSNDDKKLSFYFTHSGTILKLLAFLELYKDDFELTAENFNDNRLWKTSHIDTFSSNIIVILYDSPKHGYHIQLLHQEQVINLPQCQMNQHGMCSYDDFKKIYQNKVDSCNLQKVCQLNDEL